MYLRVSDKLPNNLLFHAHGHRPRTMSSRLKLKSSLYTERIYIHGTKARIPTWRHSWNFSYRRNPHRFARMLTEPRIAASLTYRVDTQALNAEIEK